MGRIKFLSAHTIPDSRGDATIEVVLQTKDGKTHKASVPQGRSTGAHEAVTLSPHQAVKQLHDIIHPAFQGFSLGDQKKFDRALGELDGTPDKRYLGANTTLGLSIAYARASATEAKIPLWKHIRGDLKISEKSPALFMNVVNGGLHAKNNLLFQEYLIIVQNVDVLDAFSIGEKLYQKIGDVLRAKEGVATIPLGNEGGFAPDFRDEFEPLELIEGVVTKHYNQSKISLGIDAAASGIKKSPEDLHTIYGAIIKRHNVSYLEDPFEENDFDEFSALVQREGVRTRIAGDDLTVTNSERMKKAHECKSVNSIIIKPNQVGTITEALAAVLLAKEWEWFVVVSHRSGETEDTFISDFAWAVGADGVKFGVPIQHERALKYERLMEIQRHMI